MSDANPAPPTQSAPERKPESALQQKSLLAVGFLILMFASGLLLVYLVDATPPMTSVDQEDRHAGIATPSPAESVAAAASDAPSARAPEPGSDPRLVQETQAMRELLAVTEQKVQTLEDDLKAWKDQQAKAFEHERQRIADDLAAIAQAHQRELAEDNASAQARDDALAQLKRDYATLNAQFTDDGVLVSLTESDLNFPMGGAALPSERSASLEKVAEFLGRHPNLTVLLQGHTDSLGNAARNLDLSEQRAIAVKAALVDLGVAQDRIRAEGMGETKPIVSNDTAQGRSRNRRVDIYLTER